MRLSLIFEMIVAVGAGLGLARWHFASKEMTHRVFILNRWDYNLEFAENVFVGIAMVGMVGTLIERASASGPKPWRFGRMAWVTAGCFIPITQLMYLTFRLIGGKGRGAVPFSQFLMQQIEHIQSNSGSQFLRVWPLVFPALAIACVAGRVGYDIKGDARNGLGWVFAILVVATGILNYTYQYIMC